VAAGRWQGMFDAVHYYCDSTLIRFALHVYRCTSTLVQFFKQTKSGRWRSGRASLCALRAAYFIFTATSAELI